MNKNPFSIYDFLGYLFPGAFVIILLYYFHVNNIGCFNNFHDFYNGAIFGIHKIKSLQLSATQLSIILTTSTIIAYIIGHLIGYLSSITIENVTIWFLGYPSEFLIRDVERWAILRELKKVYKMKHSNWKWKIILKSFIRSVVIILVLPISLILFIMRLLHMDDIFVKKLDNFLIDITNKKKSKLAEKLNIPDPSEYGNVDYHRLIYHYVYENLPSHQKKLDNYVALYDFLRSIALILNFAFIYVAIIFAINGGNVAAGRILVLLCLLSITFLTFMGFTKFYRRFTLEVLMALVSDIKIEKDE